MRFFASILLLGWAPCTARHILTEAGPSYERCTEIVEVCSEVHVVTEQPNGVRNVQIHLDCNEKARYASSCGGNL